MKNYRTERQKDQTQAIIEGAYNTHLGHKVLFNRDGIGNPLAEAVVVRSTYDREIEGLKFWYRDGTGPFMEYFWHDQLKECLTCKAADE